MNENMNMESMDVTTNNLTNSPVTNYEITDGIAYENIDVTGLSSSTISWRGNEGETIKGYDIKITNKDSAPLKFWQTKKGVITASILASATTAAVMIGIQAFKKADPFGWFDNKKNDRYDRYDDHEDIEEVDYEEVLPEDKM